MWFKIIVIFGFFSLGGNPSTLSKLKAWRHLHKIVFLLSRVLLFFLSSLAIYSHYILDIYRHLQRLHHDPIIYLYGCFCQGTRQGGPKTPWNMRYLYEMIQSAPGNGSDKESYRGCAWGRATISVTDDSALWSDHWLLLMRSCKLMGINISATSSLTSLGYSLLIVPESDTRRLPCRVTILQSPSYMNLLRLCTTMNTTYVTSCPATPNAYDSDVAGIGVSEPLKIPKRVFCIAYHFLA